MKVPLEIMQMSVVSLALAWLPASAMARAETPPALSAIGETPLGAIDHSQPIALVVTWEGVGRQRPPTAYFSVLQKSGFAVERTSAVAPQGHVVYRVVGRRFARMSARELETTMAAVARVAGKPSSFTWQLGQLSNATDAMPSTPRQGT